MRGYGSRKQIIIIKKKYDQCFCKNLLNLCGVMWIALQTTIAIKLKCNSN